ncbi:TetR/AcrR family transcriptional regulator [Tardiphaga sp.]|uniref:TetR/AcrR family transcriptional regulator n=1 Tax=Tardiphaga sp. TaxID=1926292 RepID=UPI00352AF77B
MVQKKNRPTVAAKPEVAAGPKRRGRPRAYAPDVAIGQALALFRKGGFAATSLDELSQVTGMNRPSLYGAFGDKRALYIKSYQRYREDYTVKVLEIFKADIDIRERLRRFYDAALDIYTTGDTAPRGCFAVMTVASDAIADPEISALMRENFVELDDAFSWCFRTAVTRGELPETIDIPTLSQLASATLNMLSIRSRAGVPRAELEAFVQKAVGLLCQSPA